MRLWKDLREQGDFGFVEILPGGKVNTEGPYLEGVKKALDEAEKVLGEKWGRQEPLRAAAQK